MFQGMPKLQRMPLCSSQIIMDSRDAITSSLIHAPEHCHDTGAITPISMYNDLVRGPTLPGFLPVVPNCVIMICSMPLPMLRPNAVIKPIRNAMKQPGSNFEILLSTLSFRFESESRANLHWAMCWNRIESKLEEVLQKKSDMAGLAKEICAGAYEKPFWRNDSARFLFRPCHVRLLLQCKNTRIQ